MLNLRFILPLLLAFVLLLAQQGGVVHALRHVLAEQTQQDNKQTPHSNESEQCTSYAQLGSALNNSFFSFDLYESLIQEPAQHHVAVFKQHTLVATARGPPVFPRST